MSGGSGAAAGGPSLPFGLKLGYSAWIAVWVPVYLVAHGPANFLWLCDVANLVVLVALWTESRLLLSSQLVSVLLVGALWCVDLGGALASGRHPIGGTEYMLDATTPLWIRLLSLFHVGVPLLLVWAVARMGYDPRGVVLQTAIAWTVLLASYVVSDPETNLNWVHGPFGKPQSALDPRLYLALCLAGYPLIVYLPTHAVVRRLFPAAPAPRAPVRSGNAAGPRPSA